LFPIRFFSAQPAKSPPNVWKNSKINWRIGLKQVEMFFSDSLVYLQKHVEQIKKLSVRFQFQIQQLNGAKRIAALT
jgi:hypothetical protein